MACKKKYATYTQIEKIKKLTTDKSNKIQVGITKNKI